MKDFIISGIIAVIISLAIITDESQAKVYRYTLLLDQEKKEIQGFQAIFDTHYECTQSLPDPITEIEGLEISNYCSLSIMRAYYYENGLIGWQPVKLEKRATK